MSKIRDYIHMWLNRHETTRTLIIIVLAILCIVEIRALAIDLRDAYSMKILESTEKDKSVNSEKDLTVDDIESWMTFSYINFVFKLPSDYLKTTLSIDDIRYPNLHIIRYARMHHLDQAQFLLQLKTAVNAYKS